jgi:thiamine-phosphate pyrophosphorylase
VFDRRQRLRSAHLYLVCDDRPDAFLTAALMGGVDIVQLRIKEPGSDEQLVATARRFVRICHEHGALMILNDRPELVAAAGADGVHVGQDDLPVPQARAYVGPERLVGLSTHTPEQLDEANGADLDYVGVGPVHATPTKPGRPPVGLRLVHYAAGHAELPFFAIGGIDAANVDAVAGAGARRIAVVRALTEATDPLASAAELRAKLSSERERVGTT